MAKAETLTDTWQDKLAETGSKIADLAADAKDKASELSRNAQEKLSKGCVATADALQSTAGSLRSGAQTSSEAIASLGNKTADTLQSTADYVRERDAKGILNDLTKVVRRNPGPSLIAAAAVGFLLGAAMRNRD